MLRCPLCGDSAAKQPVAARVKRDYVRCEKCWLIFMLPSSRLSLDDERAYYATHENNPEDSGYLKFLSRLTTPLSPYLVTGMHGLDFGCGPGPAMPTLLAPLQVTLDNYDPYFFPIVLKPKYDFITSTECFEHFHQPGLELDKLVALLPNGGVLAVMTDSWQSEAQFYDWHYTRDPTHVSFFHRRSYDWICQHYGLTLLEWQAPRVAIMARA
ncbi:class I SAM-dependent methyltransferase [Shewanella avicenniae]|uniref:Class I SAM-dependent methyltransferase n=1 Tax=Shewanella avicenniae TaxID=2814294 RepID=A0ABX7QTV4_9GAMM|nr:class I SAM-dependent methyltransferase [Shewanella avicenniae]QSX34273.1 class I SAM-dependent methyltransferase [Shewanella avicenniae]